MGCQRPARPQCPPRALRRRRRRPGGLPSEAAAAPVCYANQFEVGYNAFEFLLYFAQAYGEVQPGHSQMQARIVTVPAYAKVLLGVLDRSIGDYEAQFGEIAVPPEVES